MSKIEEEETYLQITSSPFKKKMLGCSHLKKKKWKCLVITSLTENKERNQKRKRMKRMYYIINIFFLGNSVDNPKEKMNNI